VFSNSLNTLVTMTRRTCKKGWPQNRLGYSYKNMFYIWLLCCITAENVNPFGRFFSWWNSSNLFLPHLEKFLLSTKFWTNFARCNFSSQLVLMKLTPGRAPRRARWRRILHCTLSTNLGWRCVFPWCWLYQRALLVPRSNPWSPSGSRLFWICPPKSRDP